MLEARIIKLAKEQERMRKRINDTKRQQVFVQDMKQEKQRRLLSQVNFKNSMRKQELSNRKLFMEQSTFLRENMKASMQGSFYLKQSIGNDIKEQKARIKDTIQQNRISNMQEKKALYEKITNDKNTAKQNKRERMQNMNDTAKAFYDYRINQTKNEGLRHEKFTRELEKQE